MHLMYYLDKDGKRVYTLKKSNPEGTATVSAHPGMIISCLPFLPPLRILEPYAAPSPPSPACSICSLTQFDCCMSHQFTPQPASRPMTSSPASV
jgi:hypothetical protein